MSLQWLNPLATMKKTFKSIAKKRYKSAMRTLKSPRRHRSGDKDNPSFSVQLMQAAAVAVMVVMRREPMETDVLGGGGDDTRALDSKEAKTNIANHRPKVTQCSIKL